MSDADEIFNGKSGSVLDCIDTSHVDPELAARHGEAMFWAAWKNCPTTAQQIRERIGDDEALAVASWRAYKRECFRRGFKGAWKRWDQLARTDL